LTRRVFLRCVCVQIARLCAHRSAFVHRSRSRRTLDAARSVGARTVAASMGAPSAAVFALAAGDVANKHQLRSRYHGIFPDIYLPRGALPSLRDSTAAAFLWSRGERCRGTGCGCATRYEVGARQHADRPDRLPVAGTRGIVSRRDSLHDGEITVVSGMFVTTPSRIARPRALEPRRDRRPFGRVGQCNAV
jgi:hypothetical protein